MKGGLVIMLSALNAMKQAGAEYCGDTDCAERRRRTRRRSAEKARHDLIEAAKGE
jgi:hypothetical protein